MGNVWADLPAGLNDAARALVRELRAAKDASGLSLAQLAGHTHYSRASWERWLNGKRLVTPSALAGYAKLTGIDGAALAQLLKHASLEGGSVVAEVVGEPGGVAPETPIVAQLPFAISDFTGREAALESIFNALLFDGAREAGQTPIVVIQGGGGIGKTTLAVHVAHRVADRYRDGALYVDLRGVDRDPRDPADVLAAWLVALGESAEEIPASLDERANLFRSLLREKALLLLLDNAHDAAQIRPLIPATSRGAVIVTSRAQLAHVPAAARIELEPMTYSESLTLLENVAGVERIAREPQATATVLDACAGLPLALRICAARLETRPSWSVQTLAERVSGEHRRLNELAVGDLATRSSFDMSYAQLTDEAEPGEISPARAFRLLGLTTFPEIGLLAASVLFGVEVERAEYALETLVDAHLLESPSPERYRFHDLIKLYAAERGASEPEEEQRAAIRRLARWYVYAGETAIRKLSVVQPNPTAGELGLRIPELEFEDGDEALSWLDMERRALLTVSRVAERYALHDIAAFQPGMVYVYFDLRGLWEELMEIGAIGLRSSRAIGDEASEATALNARGWVHYRQNDPELAMPVFRESLAIFTRIGRTSGQVTTFEMLASVSAALGNSQDALTYQRQALELIRPAGNWHAVLVVTVNLALDYARFGHVTEFFELSADALAEARAKSLDYVAAPLLEAAGEMHLLEGRVPEALEVLLESVALYTGLGNQPSLADALEYLGVAYAAAGEQERAIETWERSADIFESCDAPRAASVRQRISGPEAAARLSA